MHEKIMERDTVNKEINLEIYSPSPYKLYVKGYLFRALN